MMRWLFVLAAMFALGACDPHDWNDPNRPGGPGASSEGIVVDGVPLVDAEGVRNNSVQEKLTASPALCRANGGEIRPVCMRGNDFCVVQFADGGKSCTDGSQCASGRCFGDMQAEFGRDAVGTCAANNDPCGCFQLIEDGKATPGLCVD